MDLEGGVDVEAPLKALLPSSEVRGRLGDGDHLGVIDLEGATEALDPSLPADLSASGRIARVTCRRTFWTGPFTVRAYRLIGLG
jgi:hypothetical protein